MHRDYDPKYGGKPLMEFPILKRLKHKISQIGTVLIFIVVYIIFQQFGGKNRQTGNEKLESGKLADDTILRAKNYRIFHEGAPVSYPDAPVHLRPGYIPHPGEQPANQNPWQPDDQPTNQKQWPDQPANHGAWQPVNQPANQPPWNPNEHHSPAQLLMEESRGYPQHNQQVNDLSGVRGEDSVEGNYGQDEPGSNRDLVNDVINQAVQDENLREQEVKIQDGGQGQARHGDRGPYLGKPNVWRQEEHGGAPNVGNNQHDFHEVMQRYEERRGPVDENPAPKDLSHYRELGLKAIEERRQAKEKTRLLSADKGAQRLAQLANVNPANPFDQFRENFPVYKEIVRPNPKDWPVELLKKPTIACPEDFELLIVVHSQPGTFGTRRAIRSSWGTHTLEKYPRLGDQWRTIFVLGTDKTTQWENEVTSESEAFGDIIQGNFEDNEYEGTRKFLLANAWVSVNLVQNDGNNDVINNNNGCQPRFVLHTQDTIYHNMNSIIGWLAAKFSDEFSSKDIYMGKRLIKDLPIRDVRDPYYVSWQDYSPTYFPDLIQGPEILFDFNTYQRMAREATHVTKIAMVEGYIALLAQKIGVKATPNLHFNLLEETSNVCHMLRMFFVSNVKPSEHKTLYKETREALTNGKCPNAHVIQAGGQKQVQIEM